MFFLEDKHVIIAASQNNKRKKRIFSGTQEVYRKLQLNCDFQPSDKNCLIVNELFIDYNISDFFSHDKIIILDSIVDPHNVGAIIRTAAAFNFFVVLRSHKGCPINSTVMKCASGGVDYTKICIIKNYVETINKLKQNGFFIASLSETGDTEVTKISHKKIIFILGSEGDGVSLLSKKLSDFNCYIKTSEKFSTLNASVAAAITMFGFYNNATS